MTGRIRGGGNRAARNCRLGFIGGRSRHSAQRVIQSSACRRMARGCGDCAIPRTIKLCGKTFTKTSLMIATKSAFSEIAFGACTTQCMVWFGVSNREAKPLRQAVIYLRVSTIEQTTANQEREL